MFPPLAHKLLATLLSAALLAASCGSTETAETAASTSSTSSTSPATTEAPTTETPTTEAPTTETTTTEAEAAASFVPDGTDEAEIVKNWDLTFGTGSFEDRAAALEDSAELEATIASYVAAVESFGSIELPVTGISVTGDNAEITFDVLGNGATMAAELTGQMSKVDGAWIVSRDSFCEAMTLARQSCP